MNKSLRNIPSLLLVLLTGASLNAVADSYNVAPMTAGKVTVSPNDEFVNAPINLINYGTNPVKRLHTRSTTSTHRSQASRRLSTSRLRSTTHSR